MRSTILRFPFLITLAFAVAACASLPADAVAQRLAMTIYGTPNVVVVYNLATGQAESSVVGTLRNPAIFTADGRYVLWTRGQSSLPDRLELYDTVTRTIVQVPSAFQALAAHPRQPAFFGYESGAIGRLDAGGFHPFPAFPACVPLDVDVNLDGSLLAVLCAETPPGTTSRIVVFNAATGQQVRGTTIGAGLQGSIAANHDAGRVLVARALSNNASEVVVVDTVAYQVIPVFVDSPFPTGSVVGGCGVIGVSPAHDMASVHCEWTNFSARVARTETIRLNTLERRVLASVPGATSVRFSPDASTAIVNSLGAAGLNSSLAILDVVADVVTSQAALVVDGLGVAYPPSAPEGITWAAISGRVSLDWRLPAHSPAATSYMLEAGTGPGLRDLGTFALGSATSVAIPGVPAGRYHVRIRAMNHTGTSAASGDVVIDVPAGQPAGTIP